MVCVRLGVWVGITLFLSARHIYLHVCGQLQHDYEWPDDQDTGKSFTDVANGIHESFFYKTK
jgi:hypothetical protein